ncbi:hypothetical protein ACHQM5_006461 [Ranunculus cassubicifolius]
MQLLSNIHTSLHIPPSPSNPFHNSKLLTHYFKTGKLKDAKKLFDEIPQKNVVTWSIMIYGYATDNCHKESVKMFSEMRSSGINPNSFTMVAVLVNSVSMQVLEFGQSVHSLIVKLGLMYDTVVGTSVLNMYAKCNSVRDSYKVFERMNDPGLVSCNAMIAGFVHNGAFEEALRIFNRFRREGLVPNSVSMVSVIRGCSSLESDKLCGSVHGFVVKAGLCLDLPVINAILDMYSTFEDLESATKVFNEILNKDIISWTTVIGLLVRLERGSDAIELFLSMREDMVSMDEMILMNLLTACALLGDLNKGKAVHTQAIIRGFDSQLSVANSVIAMYSKGGDLISSRVMFNRMKEKTLVSWTALISGFVQNGRPREALDMWIKMRVVEQYELDSVISLSLLTACSELGALELGQQLHCYLNKAGYTQYNSVHNSLITTYSKCGNIELAYKMFEEIRCPSIVSWNAIISGYGINGSGEAAVALFRLMQKSGMEPDGVTYLNVLSACSHSGLVDDGLVISDEMMKDNMIRPSEEHWGCIVDMLARSGRLSDAHGFLSKLAENVGPNVWRALLSGCRTYDNVELAEFAADMVCQLDAENPGQVVLLSNVYASMGRFKTAEDLRSDMRVKGLVKDPGISSLNGMSGNSS